MNSPLENVASSPEVAGERRRTASYVEHRRREIGARSNFAAGCQVKCPFCQYADTQVIDSRASDEGATIRRRRKCLSCEKRFTTYERVELAMPTIIKRGGGRADYDRDKLRASMQLSMRKRPVPREAVDEAIARIEDKLLSSAQRELKSEKIGELVMRELRRLDKVAYIRFASVYRSFEDVDEFAEVVREVRPTRAAKRPKRR